MDVIVNFICTYWKEIVDVLILIGSVVFFVVKKKPVKIVDSLGQAILSVLPGFIVAVEESVGSGQGDVKKNMVLNLLKHWAVQNGLELSTYYLDFASKQIENILATPQKKGE